MNTKKKVRKAARSTEWNPLTVVADWGVRPAHAYTAGFAAVLVALMSWLASRGSGEKPSSGRWGLFIGEWAPTLFAIGIALDREEKNS